MKSNNKKKFFQSKANCLLFQVNKSEQVQGTRRSQANKFEQTQGGPWTGGTHVGWVRGQDQWCLQVNKFEQVCSSHKG